MGKTILNGITTTLIYNNEFWKYFLENSYLKCRSIIGRLTDVLVHPILLRDADIGGSSGLDGGSGSRPIDIRQIPGGGSSSGGDDDLLCCIGIAIVVIIIIIFAIFVPK